MFSVFFICIKEDTDICVLSFNLTIVLKVFTSSRVFQRRFQDLLCTELYHLLIRIVRLLFSYLYLLMDFFCLIALGNSSNTICIRMEMEMLFSCSGFSGNALQFSPFFYYWWYTVIESLYCLEIHSFYAYFLRAFIIKECWIFIKSLSINYWHGHVIFTHLCDTLHLLELALLNYPYAPGT